jgi:hypothetical protein
MRQHLDQLSKAKTYDWTLLTTAYREWIDSPPQDRLEFSRRRVSLVKKYAGGYLDQSQLLETSGSASGVRKRYFWGPCFSIQHEFFEWLKFSWFPYKYVWYVKPIKNQRDKGVFINDAGMSPRNRIITLDAEAVAEESPEVWARSTESGQSKVVLWLMPTYAKLLLERGFRFDLFDPDKTVIYATGEMSERWLKDRFRSMGFRYIDAMRCWPGGATFITCEHGNTHWIDFLADTWTDGANRLFSNDLFNLGQCFLNYENGDTVSTARRGVCRCGLDIDDIAYPEERACSIDVCGDWHTYQDLFSMVQNAIPKGLLICSFGFHEPTNTLFVLYETGGGSPLDESRIAEALRPKFPGKAIRVVHEHRTTNVFKTTKLFRVTDEEYTALVR